MTEIENKDIFHAMVSAFGMQEKLEKRLYDVIEKFMTDIHEDIKVSSSLDRFGYIKVNTSEEIEHKDLFKLANMLDFTLAMESKRYLTDYRNPDEVIEIITYQYAFQPNIAKDTKAVEE